MTELPVRVLIVDDERLARNKVRRFLTKDPRFVVVGEARDGMEALERIEALEPALLVLDIQMPGLNGFELLDALGEPLELVVIFSTAHEEHALRAFEAHAVDYLLKPYDATRFARALEKAHRQLAGARVGSLGQLSRAALGPQRKHLVVKTVEGAWLQLELTDILRLAAADKHVLVHCRTQTHTVRQALRELAARLDERFVRVHRSDIVNIEAVTRVEPWDHGDGLLVMSDGSSVVLTRTFRKAVFARIGT